MNNLKLAIDNGFGFTKYFRLAGGRLGEPAMFPSLAIPDAAVPTLTITGPEALDVRRVRVKGEDYLVGPDVMVAASAHHRRVTDPSFFDSDGYEALVRGGLSFSLGNVRGTIDTLAIGLPFRQFADRALVERLTRKFQTEFDVPFSDDERGRSPMVRVSRVLPVVQGLGSLIAASVMAGRLDSTQKATNLVVDVGHGTLNWIVLGPGLKVHPARSGSNLGGACTLAKIVAMQIQAEAAANPSFLKAIDDALRTRTNLMVDGCPVDLRLYEPSLDAACDGHLADMASTIGTTVDIDNVLVLGGAAHLYQRALARRYPKRRLTTYQGDGVQYLNLRGFQLIAERQ